MIFDTLSIRKLPAPEFIPAKPIHNLKPPPMSQVKLWVHAVWSTKNREPFFQTPALRQSVFFHIREYSHSQNINADFINGYTDHIHALVLLKSTQTIAGVVKSMKGESSLWLKQQHLVPAYFAWQTDYFAVSVSPSLLEKTRSYIRNQESHHQTQTYAEERGIMLRKWGITEEQVDTPE